MGHLLGGVTGVGQFGPDQMPISRAKRTTSDDALRLPFYDNAQRWAGNTVILFCSQLRQIDRRDADAASENRHPATWKGVKVGSEFHEECTMRNFSRSIVHTKELCNSLTLHE